MPVRIFSARAKPRPPKRVRRLRAADLPEVMATYPHQDWLPWNMLAKEWDWWPKDRAWMIDEPPVSVGLHIDKRCEPPRVLCSLFCLCVGLVAVVLLTVVEFFGFGRRDAA